MAVMVSSSKLTRNPKQGPATISKRGHLGFPVGLVDGDWQPSVKDFRSFAAGRGCFFEEAGMSENSKWGQEVVRNECYSKS